MNIYDIADKCGVSIATVSRVLNNSPKVRAQTREKVLEVIEAEGYTPNAFAQGLGSGSMGMVGVLCTDIRDPFYAEAVGHVEQYLRENNMNAILRCSGATPEGRKQALEYMVQHNVDAVVLVGSAFLEEEDNTPIAEAASRVPVILINGYIELPGVYSVTSDERGAMKDLVDLLMRRQRRRILLLHDQPTYSSRQKIAGYRDGYLAAGLEADPQLIVQVPRRLEDVNACVKQLLVRGVSFDAVIGTEDILALGTQKALQRIGLSLPIIGFNNSVLAGCATPELTSVDNNLETLCATAMEVLSNLLNKNEAPTHTEIPTRLVERDTFRAN